MQLIWGTLALCAFLAGAFAQTCTETSSCMDHAATIKTATQNRDFPALCRMQKKMADCIEIAMADCKQTGMQLPVDSVQSLEKAVTDIRTQYNQMCKGFEGPDGTIPENTGNGGTDPGYTPDSGEPIPEVATCSDFAKCMFDPSKLSSAINAGEFTAMCPILQPSTKCLSSSYNDCKSKNLMPADQLVEIKTQLDNAEKMLNQYCMKDTADKNNNGGGIEGGSDASGGNGGNGASVIGQTSMFLGILTVSAITLGCLF